MTGFPDSDTWEQRPRFKVRQIPDGPLFIAIDPLSEPLPILTEGFLGLELKPGTSRETALALIDVLTDLVSAVTYTGGKPEWSPAPGRASTAGRRTPPAPLT
jgi:hypothetical protein